MGKGKVAVLLALATVLLALVRPVCAVQELQFGLPDGAGMVKALAAPQVPEPQDACCEALQEHAISVPAVLAVPATAVLPQAPARARAPLQFAFAAVPLGAAPPPPLPYHARSARIQR